jgi:DNA polymerase sigma
MLIGILLISFLELYGRSLNYEHVAITVRNQGRYFPKSERDWADAKRPFLLSIENPLDVTHDVGANSWNIFRVRRAFYHAWQQLVAPSKAEKRYVCLLCPLNAHVNIVLVLVLVLVLVGSHFCVA